MSEWDAQTLINAIKRDDHDYIFTIVFKYTNQTQVISLDRNCLNDLIAEDLEYFVTFSDSRENHIVYTKPGMLPGNQRKIMQGLIDEFQLRINMDFYK